MSKPKFTVKKHVTLPQLSLKSIKEGDQVFIRFEGKYETKKQTENGEEKEITVATVTNLETGELQHFVVPTVIKANFDEHYENDGYADKCFMFEKGAKPAGKRYFNWTIQEITIDE